METLKNFAIGLFVALLILLAFGLGIILWPVMLGIGSLVLSLAIIVAAIVLVFYIIVFIGYIVRKAFRK